MIKHRAFLQSYGIISILVLVLMSCSQTPPKKIKLVDDSHPYAPYLNSLEIKECIVSPEIKGKHPRIFFTKKDINTIRQKAKTTNKWFFDKNQESYGKSYHNPIPQSVDEMNEMRKKHRAIFFSLGWWRLMGLNMAYLVTEEKEYLSLAKKWVLTYAGYEHWGFNVKEIDELGPSDFMAGVAATYDILYDHFTEEERRKIRQAILKNLDILYEKGFLLKGVKHGWQRDFQNNHHWNRIHSLLIASAAIYGDDKNQDSKKYLDYAYSQAMEVLRWLPEDGTNHEGPGYWAFGHKYLIRLFDCLGRLTGVNYFQEYPYFKKTMYFKMYLTTSNIKNSLYFGDANPGLGQSLYSFYRMADEFKNGHFQYYVEQLRKHNPHYMFDYTWGLLWRNADVKPQPLNDLPLAAFYPDLDLLSIRSSWKDDALVFGIKSCPPGGYKLNEKRLAKLGKDKWGSTAHDHPDQNHFILYENETYWFDDDGYPRGKTRKRTSSHNTLLVDGKGQPRDNASWYNPYGMDSTAFAKDVWYAGNTGTFIGDASRCYTGLKRFHRYATMLNGKFFVVFDDIAGDGPHDYELRFHNKNEWKRADDNIFKVSDTNNQWLGMKVLSKHTFDYAFLPEDKVGLGKPCLALSVKQKQTAALFSVIVPGSSDSLLLNNAALKETDGNYIVTVKGNEYNYLLIYNRSGKEISHEGIKGNFLFLMVRKEKNANRFQQLFVMDCSELVVDKSELLASPHKIHLNWEQNKADKLYDVKLNAPYKKTIAQADIMLGGFEKNSSYKLRDKDQQKNTQSNDQGVISLSLSLDQPHLLAIQK